MKHEVGIDGGLARGGPRLRDLNHTIGLEDPLARIVLERRAIHVNDGGTDGCEELSEITEGGGVAVEVVDEDADEVALLRILRILE